MTAVPVVRFPIFVLVRVIAFAVTALVLLWNVRYRGGFALVPENKSLLSNAHPVLMVIAHVVIHGEALLVYKTVSGTKLFKKFLHLSLQFLTFVLSMIGFVAIWKFHVDQGVDNFYSLHSWLGLACLFLFAVQWISGFLTFWFPGGSKKSRARMLPWHAYYGICIYLLGVATCITGFIEKLTFLQTSEIVSRYSSEVVLRYSTEAMLVNILGILVLVLAALLVLGVASPVYGKHDFQVEKHEDDLV